MAAVRNLPLDTVKSEALYFSEIAMTTIAFAFVIGSYLIGSLSFAVIVSRLMGLADPRSYGSGNPGATNVLRTGRKLAAVLTLLGDGIKGWVAVALTAWLGPRYGLGDQQVALAAIAVLVGHMWPIFFNFKGGKGVATAVGVLFGFNLWLALAAVATWLFMALVVRISSLSALTACVLTPVYAFFIVGPHSVFFGASIVIAILVVHRHKSNMLKLLTGAEGKIGEKSGR
jgi:glycerol-3-phosphate acyltransferase PlsY